MERRQVLSTLGLAAGASLILPAALFSGCRSEDYQGKFFNGRQIEFLDELGETLLPETPDSPGAKAAKVGNFLDSYVAECLAPEDQQLLYTGLKQLEEGIIQDTGRAFIRLSPEERHQWLHSLDQEARTYALTDPPGHFFSPWKSLLVMAYFTSMEGATHALRYLPVPGKYEGDYPFRDGDKAWAL